MRVPLTANDLEVLLHYYVSPERHPRENAPAVIDAITSFVGNGILAPVKHSSGYDVTEKGRFFIHMILSTPFPIMKFSDPREDNK